MERQYTQAQRTKKGIPNSGMGLSYIGTEINEMLPLGEENQNNIESSVHRFYKGNMEGSKFS